MNIDQTFHLCACGWLHVLW